MDRIFKESLLINSLLISESFKRNPNDVINVLSSLSGSKEEMLSQFFSGLNLPITEQSVILLYSIAKYEKKEENLLTKIKKLIMNIK